MTEMQASQVSTTASTASQGKESLLSTTLLHLLAKLRTAQAADTKRNDGRETCLQGAIQKESQIGPKHKKICIAFQNGEIQDDTPPTAEA